MRLSTLLLAVAVLLCACGGSGFQKATHSPSTTAAAQASPSTSPTASPSAVATPPASAPPPADAATLGVLAGPLSASSKYTVTLVGVDGRIVASAQADALMPLFCSNGTAASLPLPVSTSNTRAYFMDASGVVRFLAPDGSIGRVISLPFLGVARRSFFAVSPDDKRIAVAVVDFAAGAATTLYVEDLGGTNQVAIFSETGAYTLWPIGWHGGNLVLAKVPACAQGGGPFCCGPQELHVVDPATARRLYTLGGSGCVVAGMPTTAGVACEDSTFTHVRAINWSGGVVSSFQIQGAAPAYVMPDGNGIAVVRNGETDILAGISLALQACGFIDQYHLLAGGDAQQQPRIADYRNGKLVPVAAQGDCAGRIPGAL